jgi:hypothetical protein
LRWEEKFALGVWYVDHRSARLGLRMLADTVRVVLPRYGISAEGEATAPQFLGSAPDTAAADAPVLPEGGPSCW